MSGALAISNAKRTPCATGDRTRWPAVSHRGPGASRLLVDGQQAAVRLDNWCAPAIHWCAPVGIAPHQNGPSGWHPAEALGIELGVAMQPHGIAMPADQARSPTTAAGANTLVAVSHDDTRGITTNRRSAVSEHAVQGNLTPERLSVASRQPGSDGAPGTGPDRSRKDRSP